MKPPIRGGWQPWLLAFVLGGLLPLGDAKEKPAPAPDLLVKVGDLRTRRTVQVTPGFKGARHTAAVVCHDRLCVIGGNADSSEFDVSDLIQVFALTPHAPQS